MILISSIPKDRANHSIDALKAGKDVMVDKPGCTTLDQLDELKKKAKLNVKRKIYSGSLIPKREF